MAPLRSEGQRLLCEVSASLSEIAGVLDCSKQAVWQFRTGRKRPGRRARAVLEGKYGIGPIAWESVPGTSPTEAAAVPWEPPGTAASDVASFDLGALLWRELARPGLLTSEKTKLISALTKHYSLRAQIERDVSLVDPRVVFESPAWARIKGALVCALEPYPAAQREMTALFASLEDEV